MIDEAGKQLGVFNLDEAIKTARERNLDLIQVTEKATPPVCKIMEYGKYIYWLQKKEKGPQKSSQVKGIRLGFNISQHDMETRAMQAEKFLKSGDRVKIEMILRGREKGQTGFAKDKVKKFIEILMQRVPVKVEGDIRREPRGFTIIVSKQ